METDPVSEMMHSLEYWMMDQSKNLVIPRMEQVSLCAYHDSTITHCPEVNTIPDQAEHREISDLELSCSSKYSVQDAFLKCYNIQYQFIIHTLHWYKQQKSSNPNDC
jgi:hypothetical protein